jgi:hypothetical protein
MPTLHFAGSIICRGQPQSGPSGIHRLEFASVLQAWLGKCTMGPSMAICSATLLHRLSCLVHMFFGKAKFLTKCLVSAAPIRQSCVQSYPLFTTFRFTKTVLVRGGTWLAAVCFLTAWLTHVSLKSHGPLQWIITLHSGHINVKL